MNEVINLDQKRVCDMSADKRTIEIRKRDCVTKILANSDGTLKVVNERAKGSDLNNEAVPKTQ